MEGAITMVKRGRKKAKIGKTDTLRALFGKRLRQLRQSMELSQEQLALNAGIPTSYVSELERGLKNLTLDNLEKLSKGLGLPVFQLFLFDTESNQAKDDQLVDMVLKILTKADTREKKSILDVAKTLVSKK